MKFFFSRLLVVCHADVVQLLDHHCEQGVHISLFREVSVALFGLDNENDVGRRRYVAAVETQKFAFVDIRVVGNVTPVAQARIKVDDTELLLRIY